MPVHREDVWERIGLEEAGQRVWVVFWNQAVSCSLWVSTSSSHLVATERSISVKTSKHGNLFKMKGVVHVVE